ncbi:hypothetical protein FW774_08140 [Pedobacter sp. BS3]|uniref:hypothetical protein n=1 Tax=Pedobacter sp. BS3 TaxID=2567937 RepID=UPI0011EE6BBD|nr:hypothetical protein [Pedobacter sp. BS3]TZF84928.1 hypothetical protein FW774_08140 [Pedobacter sp. BS3]
MTVLQSEVYNYSWRKFPYIWNEIPFHIAYESDLAYVEAVLCRTAKDVLVNYLVDPKQASAIRSIIIKKIY